MNALYNLGIALYGGAARVAALRSPKVRRMLRGQRLTLQTLSEALEGLSGRPVWVHAASLGEFEQARPVIERLPAEVPVVVTFFSPSGYEVRRDYPRAAAVAYLPFDTPANARRLLDTLRPSVALFIKYEFWGNYLQELQRRGVPTYLVSGIFRPGQIFFRPWGGQFRKMLRRFTRLYVQDEASRKLLEGIGLGNVVVAGDTRLDRMASVMRSSARALPAGFDTFGQDAALRFIAGSSWEADERVYRPWLADHPEVAFVIAPHEFDAQRLGNLSESFTFSQNRRAVLLSQWEKMPDSQRKAVRGIIVDSFGKLSSLYAWAQVAYVGGGFGTGIHNVVEPAIYGIPVFFGPRHGKFREALGLIAAGGAFAVAGASDFSYRMDDLLERGKRAGAGKAAGEYIASNLGATDKIMPELIGIFGQDTER